MKKVLHTLITKVLIIKGVCQLFFVNGRFHRISGALIPLSVLTCQKGTGIDEYDNTGHESLKNWLIINELFNKNYNLSNGVFFVFSLA
jgi:hypothetical protein